MMEDFPYEVGASEKVKIFEAELKSDLAELKAELEENEIIHGVSRVISSVAVPKDVGHFWRERGFAIKKGLKVSEVIPLICQADQMTRELELCQVSDYAPEGLPLLIHQHFVDRIHQLIQCKYMHLLRWKRFQAHTRTIESIYPDFKQRLDVIMAEFSDCVQRAQRLSVAHETFLAKDNHRALMSLKPDDVLIYLRSLVAHFASLQKVHQYLRVLEWLPVVHRFDVSIQSSTCESTGVVVTPMTLSRMESSLDTSVPLSSDNVWSSSAAISPTFAIPRGSKASQQIFSRAAAGGGLASDEVTLGLPLSTNQVADFNAQLNQLLILYGIETKMQSSMLSSDEMELYANVLRKFRTVFIRQEHMRTFRMYDLTEASQKTWGADFSIHALKKDSNWTSFIDLHPELDPYQEKQLVDLRKRKNVDLLLEAQAHFVRITDAEKVTAALKSHAAAVREPPNISPINVEGRVAHRVEGTAALWQKIYTSPELYRESDVLGKEAKEAGDGRGSEGRALSARVASSRSKRKSSFDYFNAVQMLGLDEGDQESKDPTSLQGALLSFLFLRHLRIRDLQRTCLSVLNYFRSIERTLTINDSGLTCDGDHYKTTSPQSHKRLTDGGNGGIGSHKYIHNTPADYRMSETEFMEWSELDNHDDFYTTDEGRIHVQDQRGLYVVYSAAVEDLKNLESDLLLVATHFLQKDRDRRSSSKMKRPNTSRQVDGSVNDFQINAYGHQEVDRFGILLDLWTNEAAFLDAKRELLDCFMEAYCHVFDRDERRRLAQCVTNVMHRRPRFDFESAYFVKSYRLECDCLRTETKLIKSILDNQIEEQRQYTDRVCREREEPMPTPWGMPHSVIRKQLVSVNSYRSALKDVYLLEFHPSLAIASQLPGALKHAFWELFRIHQPDSVTQMVELEKRMLECAWNDWEKMPTMGASYSQQVQKELFSGAFIEDPQFVCEAAQTVAAQAEQQSIKKSLHDRQLIILGCLGNMLELITVRSRLIDAAWQSEILAKIYKKQMVEVEVEDCHLYMRFVQFEFAQVKESGSKRPSVFTSPPREDPRLDRFTPNFLSLAVNELDEGHVGRFSFRSLEGILQMLRDKSIGSIRSVLAAQVVHKNSLICAVQLSEICHQMKDATSTHRPVSPSVDAKGDKVMTNLTVHVANSLALTTTKPLLSTNVKKRAPQSFISLQLEKVPYRDKMLTAFAKNNSQMSAMLQNAVEMEKLKRKLIFNFCEELNGRMVQHSLRTQIIAYYDSILRLIEDFPAIKDKYFMIGEPNERRSVEEEVSLLEPDPRCFKRRPRSVLSDDGLSVLNVWFVPHPLEILSMFRQLSDHDARHVLTNLLTIVGALHDILQFLFGHARLGTAWRYPSIGGNGMTADWGGTDAIGVALRELQRQLDNLSPKTDAQLIGRFLLLRRDVIFHQFDVVIRHTLRDHFLATGNVPAFKAVTSTMHFGLHNLSNAGKPTVMSTYLNIPEPLEVGDAVTLKLYPWRNFINSNGPYAVQFWQWQLIEYHIQTCLCGLTDVNRRVANAELVSMALLMEDVLLHGSQDPSTFASTSDDPPTLNGGDQGSRRGSFAGPIGPGGKKTGVSLSLVGQPMESYSVMRSFLVLWKRLERFKRNWVRTRLGVDEVNTVALYKTFCRDYRKEVMLPVMQGIARDRNQPELYDALVAEEDSIALPKGVSETESKTRQLVQLLSRFECHLIVEVKKRLQKELTLALAERAREENALPTDLWKRPSMRETLTVTRAQVADDFIDRLMSDAEVGEDRVVIRRDRMTKCLNELSQNIVAREKLTYESYSSFYENLLRTNHQMLYQKEREVKHLRDQLKSHQSSVSVEVQFQLAEASQDLVLEVIALRAKVDEMKELNRKQEQDIRHRIRLEYDDLVHSLVRSIFDLKTKFDEFRRELYDDILEKISLTRTEAVDAVSRLAQRTGASTDAEAMKRSLATTEQLRSLQEDKHAMSILLLKLRAMGRWRIQHETGVHKKQKSQLVKMFEMSAKDRIRDRMTYEKEKHLLQEQMIALRSALKASQAENEAIRKDLEKEMREKTDKSHSTQQQALSLKQLEEARLAKIKKLCTELEENKGRLQMMSEEQERTRRLQLLSHEKVKKDADAVRKQLQLERTLKLSAFQCVEELRAEMTDRESGPAPPPATTIRPHTALTCSRSSRLNSAAAKSVPRVTRAMSAPYRPLTEPRCSSSAMADHQDSLPNNAIEYKKLQRPKTGSVRFRTVLANQLLNELAPPSHREFARIRSAQTTDRSQSIEMSAAGLRPPAAN